MLVRWSWPRFRFDQLMALAWKVMLPLGLVNLVAVAVMVEYGLRTGGEPNVSWLVLIVGGWVVAVVGWVGAAMASPLHSDNRPRINPQQFDAERRIDEVTAL
jgi:NADH-quinone oxidoreductase subunit H